MTEEEVGRQAEGEAEAQELPTPVISADSTVAGSAEPSFDVDALANKVMEKINAGLDDRVDARVKSMKDRRFNTLAKADEILAFVEASGGDVEKVKDTLAQGEMLSRLSAIEERLGSGGAVGAAPGRADPDKSAEILQKAGISFDDPEVVEWANKKSFTSETQAITALEAIATKRAKQANVGPAATVGSGGAPISESGGKEGLLTELEAIQEGQRGSVLSPENIKRSAEIVAELNKIDPQLDLYNDDQYYEAKQKGYSTDWFGDVPGPSGLEG